MPFLEWRDLAVQYGARRALDGFSLSVEEGEILAILGPSGSGKSTLLRVTAGLEQPAAGEVLLEGRSLAGVPAHRRGFGLMFQEYCLFPHLDVQQNVSFGLRMQGADPERRTRRVQDMLDLVRLSAFAHRNVVTLSGGEQQRVALARSLAPAPRLLMLDEPLGAVDEALKTTLLEEISGIIRGVGVTALYVTHDQAEAMSAATRIALVNDGRLVQVGPAADLVSKPASSFVAAFLGLGALVPEEALADIGADGLRTRIPGPGGKLLVRPHALRCASGPGLREVHARILSRIVRPLGVTVRIALQGGDGREYPMEVPQASAAGPSGCGSRGFDCTFWLDLEQCQPLPL